MGCKKLQIIFQMSLILSYNLQKPIIKIGRLAGQFAKPRSSKFEIKESLRFPSYMGDAVNSKNFTSKLLYYFRWFFYSSGDLF